jgi:hypothetical protein
MIELPGQNNQIKGKIKMRYIDYELEISNGTIKFDTEFKLPDDSDWKDGDHFQLKIDDDEVSLVKINDDPGIIRGYN